MTKKAKPKKLSQPDMILVALYKVAQGTKEKVPEEEIIIRVWQEFPESFSLRNHSEYPDGSAVSKRMADKLKPQGLVIGLGDNIFRLTEKGIFQAKAIIDALGGKDEIKVATVRQLSREEENFINLAYKSQAFSAWQKGQQDSLIDYDAKLFFQFSTGTKLDKRTHKVNFAQETLAKAKQLNIPKIDELQALLNFLLNNFSELFDGE